MRQIKTDTPPVIRERDGQWFIVVIAEGIEISAPIGAWFAAQFATRIIVPQLALNAMKEPNPNA